MASQALANAAFLCYSVKASSQKGKSEAKKTSASQNVFWGRL